MKSLKYGLLLVTLIAIAFWSWKSITKSNIPKSGYHESIIFPLQKEHVHGPTIVELPNGDLLAGWFQGSGERWADDVRIMGSRLELGDTVWSEPFVLADEPGFPDINPMMFMDTKNRLWLMWYPVIANQWETSLPMYRISEDYNKLGAPKWNWQEVLFVKPGDKTERGIQTGDRFVDGVRRQLTEYEKYMMEEIVPLIPADKKDFLMKEWEKYKFRVDSLATGRNMIRSGKLKEGDKEVSAMLGYPLSRRIGWQTKNKPVIISDRLIVPLYSDGFDCSLFAVSDNLGATWQFSNPVLGGFGIQPTIAVAKDGSLAAYLRDNGPPPHRQQLTRSYDSGITWTIAKDTDIPNPGAGFDMTNLSTGEWIMVYNDQEEGRSNLTVAISDNDGKTWRWKRKVEDDQRPEKATSSHYPAIIQGKNGLVHIVYSYHRKDQEDGMNNSIKYASFAIDWIKN